MKNKKITIIITILIVILIITIGNFLFFNKELNKSINNLEDLSFRYNELHDINQNIILKFYKKINISKYITNDFKDTNEIGKYNITYKLHLGLIKKEITKKIIIYDDIPPIINIDNKETTISIGDTVNEINYNASDEYDGDITDKVTITSNVDINKSGIYTITYEVSDSSNNKNSIERKIIVKEKEPIYEEQPKEIFTRTKNVEPAIEKYLNELDNYLSNYKVSVAYYNLDTKFTYLYNADKVYFGASLIKTVDAMYVYEKMELNDTLENKVKLAISKSDNNAHNYLVNLIGHDNLRTYGNSLGATRTLDCNSNFCNTTVYDQLYYLKHLYGLIKNNDKLKNYFINDYGNYLSFDYSYTNLHKYGHSDTYFHDVGIFLEESPYIIVVLTEELSNDEPYVAKLISDISLKINNLNNLI